MWPPFGFDVASVANLDWTVSGDLLSLQQVATASNATHSIIIELTGSPPMIVGIETYSGDEEQFRLKVTTGEDVTIDLREGCLLYTSPSPRDQRGSRMPSSA